MTNEERASLISSAIDLLTNSRRWALGSSDYQQSDLLAAKALNQALDILCTVEKSF